MTAQPTTRITAHDPQPVVHGTPQRGPVADFPPVPPQQYGPGSPPPFSPPPFSPPPFSPPPVPPAAPRRSTGKVVGAVVAALVLLAGLAVAALSLFGSRTVTPESVQQEIVRITQAAVQVVPVDVVCPSGVEARAGGTFTCTATVDGQPVTYDVRQDDDQGHLTITYDRLVKVADLEATVAGLVGKDVDVPVTVRCDTAGRSVVVNAPGTPIACTAANADDPDDNAPITVTVAADGTPAYTFA